MAGGAARPAVGIEQRVAVDLAESRRRADDAARWQRKIAEHLHRLYGADTTTVRWVVTTRAAAMSTVHERLGVIVSYDPRRGYVASAPELKAPVVALSLGGLRRRIEALLLPDEVDVVLQLDALAERERHRRRAMPPPARVR
jgi:hypothetical protein